MSEGASSHRHKKVRKPEAEADPEFQIAPMIDILLVLLVFFMSISTTEVLQRTEGISLPIAKDAKDTPKQTPAGQVIINISFSAINNSTSIEVDEKTYDRPDDLVNLLQSRANSNPLVRVVVRADKQVRYEYLRKLLEAVGKSQIGNVTFSVVDKEEEGAPPS